MSHTAHSDGDHTLNYTLPARPKSAECDWPEEPLEGPLGPLCHRACSPSTTWTTKQDASKTNVVHNCKPSPTPTTYEPGKQQEQIHHYPPHRPPHNPSPAPAA
ncbi:hypothetical protein ACOMHN_048296 [Nucella lapillus]